jgi:hypothetical protein
MFLRLVRIGVVMALVGLIIALGYGGWQYTRSKQIRQALYDAIEPVAISDCQLQRFGDANDGGYVFCGNFLGGTEVAYSYGINGTDNWGCEISKTLAVPVHQYDCFNTAVPPCPGGDTRFHAECVGPGKSTSAGRLFDSIGNQVSKNGDTGKRILMKMDVEGSEWQSLLTTPDAVLNEIDQLAVEFHEVETASFLATIERVKRFFHVAHVHMNNYGCAPGFEPFPSRVFEVLFVSKRLGQANRAVHERGRSPFDAPNSATITDCQDSPGGSELTRIGRWTRRTLRARYDAWTGKTVAPY